MDDEELKELEDPESWEFPGFVLPPVPNPGAVVSVRFSVEEFQALSREASNRRLKVTDFIRQAALSETLHPAQGPDTAPIRRPA
jgi:hypothetical protein